MSYHALTRHARRMPDLAVDIQQVLAVANHLDGLVPLSIAIVHAGGADCFQTAVKDIRADISCAQVNLTVNALCRFIRDEAAVVTGTVAGPGLNQMELVKSVVGKGIEKMRIVWDAFDLNCAAVPKRPGAPIAGQF